MTRSFWLAAIVCSSVACSPATERAAIGSKTIGKAGGTIAVEAALLAVPPDALFAPTSVTLARTGRAYDPAYQVTPEYEVGPAGLVFESPATLQFDVAGSDPSETIVWTDGTGRFVAGHSAGSHFSVSKIGRASCRERV